MLGAEPTAGREAGVSAYRPSRPPAKPMQRTRGAAAPDTISPQDSGDRVDGVSGRLLQGPLHLRLLWLLVLGSFLLRLLWLAQPDGGLIFDEKYYVNSARVILGIAPDPDIYQDKPLGLDPNTEHPPLAKLIVAG